MEAVSATLRERRWLWRAVGLVALTVFLREFTGLTRVGLALVLGVFVAAGAFERAVDAAVVSERVAGVARAVVPLVVAGYLVVGGAGDFQSATLVATVGLQHAVETVRTGLKGDTDDEQAPDTPTTRRVRAALDRRPRTRRELWDAVDAEADAVDDALDRLHEVGAVERAGSEFRIATDEQRGLRDRLWALVPGRDVDRTVDDESAPDYDAQPSPVEARTGPTEWGHAGREVGSDHGARADEESREQAHERRPETTN